VFLPKTVLGSEPVAKDPQWLILSFVLALAVQYQFGQEKSSDVVFLLVLESLSQWWEAPMAGHDL
jgi:hypothetical protein